MLNYNAFIGIMLQGIIEQSSKNKSLETQTTNQDSIIAFLQNQMNQSVTNNTSLQNQLNVLNTVKAQMLFYNAQGKLIQSTELTQKGKGTLNVFASDLSFGIYTYTLVLDGKVIEMKKMIKQ